MQARPDAEPLADWLRAHGGVQIVCRDRAGAYADGARDGAPEAIQVADRWHVWHNLGEAVDKTVAAHHGCVRAAMAARAAAAEPEPDIAPDAGTGPVADTAPATGTAPGDEHDVCGRERRLVVRTRERYTAVQQLLADGASLGAISRQLELDRDTVRRFARADSIDELLVKAVNRTSRLDGYTDHLTTRFAAAVTDAVILHAELTAMGYTGSVQTVRRYLHPLRQADSATSPAPRARPPVPKPRHITRWIMTDPARLDPDGQVQLATVLASCPELAATARHVYDFAELMNKHHGEQLPDWIQRVDADDLPALHSLTTGLRRDQAAVTNGLTLHWNSGRVEGNVNRIKTIKRQMYGRASFSLLRKRILLAA